MGTPEHRCVLLIPHADVILATRNAFPQVDFKKPFESLDHCHRTLLCFKMLMLHRTVARRRLCFTNTNTVSAASGLVLARFHLSARREEDPRLRDATKRENWHLIEDQFALLRDEYKTPKHPIILAHGLLGFDELHLEGAALRGFGLPGIRYWRGISEVRLATPSMLNGC